MKKLPNSILVAVSMVVSGVVTWWIATGQVSNSGVAEAAEIDNGVVSTVAQDSASVAAQGLTQTNIADIKATIQQRLSQSRPDLIVSEVKASVISGLYDVKVENGPTLYVTADGSYFVMGDLFKSMPGGFVNIAEQAREGERASAVASIDVSKMIVFAPKQQPSKAIINVFTDVDCYYCQKLHNEVPDLNRVGIEVRYLAFPRAGFGSESYKKIASAWCASNKQEAMTKLKRRQNIPENVCKGNPVNDQYTLGQRIGVTGTPALITKSGRLMPGYMPPLQLAQALGVEVSPELTTELLGKQEAAAKQK